MVDLTTHKAPDQVFRRLKRQSTNAVDLRLRGKVEGRLVGSQVVPESIELEFVLDKLGR
jgi:hypothetical protein